MDNIVDLAALPQTAASRHASRRIAIASGKGGVGKTWFAITLAHALAEAEARVLLVDGDFGLANIDIQLGLTPTVDLGRVLAGSASVEQALTRVQQGGFNVLPGRSGSGALAALPPARLEWLLALFDCRIESHVLLDLGAGLDAANRRMATWSDTLLVVATDDPTSLTDAYAVLKLHAADRTIDGGPADTRIVVNQAGSLASGQRTYDTLARACRQFLGVEPSLAGIIRRDEHVRDSIRRQMPLLTRHPACQAAQDVRAVARDL